MPIDHLDPEKLSAFCKALGHPIRIEILRHLKEVNNCICGQIVDIFPLSQSTISQHLKQLKNAGLVIGEIEGPRTCYCLNTDSIKLFKDWVANL